MRTYSISHFATQLSAWSRVWRGCIRRRRVADSAAMSAADLVRSDVSMIPKSPRIDQPDEEQDEDREDQRELDHRLAALGVASSSPHGSIRCTGLPRMSTCQVVMSVAFVPELPCMTYEIFHQPLCGAE